MKKEKAKRHNMTPHEVVDFLIDTVSVNATNKMLQADVAKQMGVNKEFISTTCRVLGIKTPGKGAPGVPRGGANHKRDAQVIKWRSDGKTMQWIADRLFITRQRVDQIIKKHEQETAAK